MGNHHVGTYPIVSSFRRCDYVFFGWLFDRVDLIKPVSNVCPSLRTRTYMRTSVRPSTKSFFHFTEIWQYDPIQCQGHEPFRVGNLAIFKSYLLCHLQWELATDHWFLNYSIISKFTWAGFLIFGLVFVSRVFEIGMVCQFRRVDCQSRTGLTYILLQLEEFPQVWCSRLKYLLCVCSRHDFFTIVDLPVGSHQYKFYVDGQWHCDDKEVLTALLTCLLTLDWLHGTVVEHLSLARELSLSRARPGLLPAPFLPSYLVFDFNFFLIFCLWAVC